MSSPPIERKVRYERDLDPHFAQEISAMPGGEQLAHCIQCGTCSATCPLSIYMDYTPRRIIAMTRAGLKDDVLRSLTIWLCASCYSCTVECPKNIKITDIMYALKRRAIEKNIYPKRFGIPVLSREFFRLVQRNGRSSEGRVIVRMALKTNPFQYMKKKALLGLKLMRQGRLSMKKESIKRKGELTTILRGVEQAALELDRARQSGRVEA
ncbi:MAG: 4Fe-4S dicluster domain-containing protein [Candidatus Neomarinimicrobiota bacterium]